MKPAAMKLPRTEVGFTLVELLLGIIVLSIGILGMASAMASMTRYRDLAAAHADMTALGDGRIERLRVASTYRNADTMQLVIGGSTTVPTANHVDTLMERGRTYVRLWEISAGPGGTRQVNLRVQPINDDARVPAQVNFTTLIQMVQE